MFRRSVADMSSIAFILRKSLKNNILELLRHPGKLVAYLFVAACLLFSALSMACLLYTSRAFSGRKRESGPRAKSRLRRLRGSEKGKPLDVASSGDVYKRQG